MSNVDNGKRNNYQQYDWVEIFKNFETKISKGIHIASLAVVTESNDDKVKCIPFPIEEDTEPKVIEAYNMGKATFNKGDKCLVLFTDRDFRYNKNTATTDETSINKTNNATLHSDLYGIVIPMASGSASESDIAYVPSYNDDGSITFNKQSVSETASSIKTGSLLPSIDNDTKQWKIGNELTSVRALGENGTSTSVKLNGNNLILSEIDANGNTTVKANKQIVPTIENNKWVLNSEVLGKAIGEDGVGVKSASIVNGKLSIINTNNEKLIDNVQVKGDDGLTPEITQNGNVLTIKVGDAQKFNADLKGEAGKDGTNGTNGKDGENGKDGRSIASVTDYYLASEKSSNVTIDGNSWSTAIPELTSEKKYLWNYEVVIDSDGNIINTTKPMLIGSLGDDGIGIASIVDYYYSSNDAKNAPTNVIWSTSPTAISSDCRYLWNYEVITYSNNTTKSSTPCVIGVYGDTGNGISSVDEYYLATSMGSNVKAGVNPSSNEKWTISTSGIPAMDETKKYLWNYEVIHYTDSTKDTTSTACLIGTYSKDGKGIKSITDYYQANSSQSTPSIPTYNNGYSGWSTAPENVTISKRYLWNFERIEYTEGDATTTTPSLIGNFASSVKKLEMYYAVNNDSNTAPATFSTTKVSPTSSNRYLWMKTYTEYDTTESGKGDFSDAQIISVYGEKGDTGKGISSIVTYYALSSTTETPTSGWDATAKTPNEDNKYLWEKTRTTYSDGTYSISTNDGWTEPHIVGVFGKDGSDADVNFANCCNALGITEDTSGSGIYQKDNKLAINADVILTDDLFANKIKSVDVEAENLKVKMANVDGTLNANKITITADDENTIYDAYSTSGKYTCIYNTDLSSYTMINGKFFGEAVLSTTRPYFRDAGISTYSEKPYGSYPDSYIAGGVMTVNGESYSTNYYARGICYTHKTFDSDGNQLTTGSYILMLPDKSGTIATTDDIKAATGTDMSKYLTTDAANQTYAKASHTHAISDITNLQSTLDGKASSSHSHTISDVTGLSAALSGKASSSHTHFTEVSLGYKDLLSTGSIITFLNKLCDATTVKNVYLHCTGLPYVSLYYDVITGDYALYANGTMYTLETMQKISGFVDKIVGIVYIA